MNPPAQPTGVILTLLWRATHRPVPPGPWLAALGRRAFAIYVIHPVVLIGVAVGWRSVAWSPLLKVRHHPQPGLPAVLLDQRLAAAATGFKRVL